MRVRVLLGDYPPDIGTKVLIEGWVRTRRDSKGFSFLEVNDGSCLKSLQILAEDSLPGFAESIARANIGATVRVRGEVVESPGKGQKLEVRAESLEVLGDSDAATYPLQKKRHSNEFLRGIAHLRTRTNTFGAVFRLRSLASHLIHEFFAERDFIHLHSPVITTSDCEGAGQLFRVTTLGAGETDFSKDFFGQEAHLTVSGQLEAECFSNTFKNTYTFGPTFRAENSNTARHLAEFWMVEPEMAFCDLQGNMALAEDFMKQVISRVLERGADDMSFFNQWIEKGIIESLEGVASAQFEHLTYTEAIDILKAAPRKFEYPVEWGQDLQTEHERFLTEEHVKAPVFVTNYPRSIKAFYMRLDDDERTVSAMDLLVPRLGEIIGGSQREERLDVLEKRIEEESIQGLDWYLDLRRFGTVQHSGFGLGFERLMMYLTGMQNIRDVIPFPRTPGNAAF